MWVAFTLLAAFSQAWRNALQSELSKEVDALGVTLARFVYAGPMAALYLSGIYWLWPAALPTWSWQLGGFIVAAALMQILATGLMIRLFQMKNFAVGAGLAKSEALFAAIFGVVAFGTSLSTLGWLGVFVGAAAVLLLSGKDGFKQLSWPTLLTGMACGSAFALTSLWIREASLVVNAPFPHRAAWVLLLVISLQTLILLIYLALIKPDTLKHLQQRRISVLKISACSCLGSIGWFSAMALTAVPLVKTLGQIEVLFTLMVAALWLKQKVQVKEVGGLVLIAIAAILVIWG